MSNLSKKFGCLGISLDFLQGKSNSNAAELSFTYGLEDAFLSPAERSFFGVLQKVIPKDQYLVDDYNQDVNAFNRELESVGTLIR